MKKFIGLLFLTVLVFGQSTGEFGRNWISPWANIDSIYALRASIGGTSIKSNGSIVMAAGDTIFIKDATGVDSGRFYDDGTRFYVNTDNLWRIYAGTASYFTLGDVGFYYGVDTAMQLGGTSVRFKECDILRQTISSPNRTDSCTQYYDASGVYHIKPDSSSIAAGTPDTVLVHGVLKASKGIINIGCVKTFSVAGTSDTVGIANVSILKVDASGGSITIGGFTGGITGQILHVYNSAANNLTLEDDEATGNQDIKCPAGTDITITVEGGATLLCDGTLWWIIGIAQ